ncbi:MAG: DJ-1/PfpI family protein [Methylococcaceae bacterium]|nr:DJ-1/PfpI family protein [Methylococcaceae bacterium]
MLPRSLLLIAATLLPLAASATDPARHLSREELIALAPSPDIRPTVDATKQYVSGGIGILIYDGVNAMDALGPYQTFSSAGLRPMLISATKDAQGNYKSVITSNSNMQMTAHRNIGNTTDLEVLVVPGGAFETALLATNTEVLNWIKAVDRNTIWTTSVCTGSWVLGAAGLLQGKKATSNWYHADELLAHFGAIPKSGQRYVFDGKIITGAGVTAGIDMALALVKKVFQNDLNGGRDYTQAVMLELQYDPRPPIKGGAPEKTDPAVFDAMQWMYDYFGLADYVRQIPIQ